MKTARLAFFLLMLSLSVLSGCAHVVTEGSTKTNFPPLWQTAGLVMLCSAGAVASWFFRKKSFYAWFGVVGLPPFALFMLIAGLQLKGLVDSDHFEMKSFANHYSIRFDELSRIVVVEERPGRNKYGTETVRYYVDLHKRNGETQQINVAGIMAPLWKDIVHNAKRHGVTYVDQYNYLDNPR